LHQFYIQEVIDVANDLVARITARMSVGGREAQSTYAGKGHESFLSIKLELRSRAILGNNQGQPMGF